MELYIAVTGYLFCINIAAFIMMGIDKNRAINHKWRIKEKTLFLCAAAGGSIGSIFGMKYFKHKTKHKRFSYGIPILLFLQLILGFVIFFRITHFRF